MNEVKVLRNATIFSHLKKAFLIFLGPVVGLLVGWLLYSTTQNTAIAKTAAIATWMAIWWITEAVQIYITALMPVIFFPLLGVLGMKEVAPNYMNHIIFLFIGGFIIAFALERWNLHKRIALKLILKMGFTPSRILLGFMLASYLLSMWILNTATVMMMLPAMLAVIAEMEKANANPTKNTAVPYLLGLAFASSIGGTASLLGTAPNLYLMQFYNENFNTFPPITFANWMAFGLPMSLVFFFVCYWFINNKYLKNASTTVLNVDYCKNEYDKLGKVSYEEKAIGFVFCTTVFLWFFGKNIAIGSLTIPGWTNLLPDPTAVKESTVAILAAFVLLIIPAKNKAGTTLVTWKEVQKLPFGVIILFGGGFALAAGVTSSGLGEYIAANLSSVTQLHPMVMVAILCVFMTFFTELTSNTASTILVLGLLLPVAMASDFHPLLLLLPVTLSASFAFMLPVATPPNTIVYASEKLPIKEMIRTGIWLNLIGIVIVLVFTFTLGKVIFRF